MMAGGTKRQKDLRKALRVLAPRIPMADAENVMTVAAAGHLRHLPPSISVWQALTTHIRHERTEYDALLAEGYDRDAARYFVLEPINSVLQDWGSQNRITEDDTDSP